MVFIGFIANVILTWSIGLAIPLIIRYAIYRKPLSKTNAIIINVVNFIITFSIFIALGSKSKTHMVLYIMALCSYGILHNGYTSKKDSIKDVKSYVISKKGLNIDDNNILSLDIKSKLKIIGDLKMEGLINDKEYESKITEIINNQ